MKITVYEVDTGYFVADPVKYGTEYNTGEPAKVFTRKKEAEQCFQREAKRLLHNDVDWFGVKLTEIIFSGSPRAIAASALQGKTVDGCVATHTVLDKKGLTEKEAQKRWAERNYL